MSESFQRPPLDPTPWHAVRRHGRLWRRFALQAVVRETHFRAHLAATVVVGIVQSALSLLPLLLLYSYTDDVNGWSQGEVIALTGVFQLTVSILAICVSVNMWRLSGAIRSGDLDLVLVRPVSSQFFMTLRWLQPGELFNVLTGVGLIAIGLIRDSVSPSLTDVVQGMLLIACGCVLLTCLWSATAILAFWLTSVEPLPMLFRDLLGAGMFPLGFYPASVRVFLTFVFPVGFATTFPTEALVGEGSWGAVVLGIALSAGLLLLLRAYWRIAVRSYASASS